VGMGVAVAAIRDTRRLGAALLLAITAQTVWCAVLPEDRADALYHSYDGGGVEVTGPSILVRKGDAKNFSLSANYYADSISSASIDVVTQGSPYSEQRNQWSGSVDYLHADTIMSFGYTNSDESDYKADTYNVSLSQTMFGALTTVTLGYSRGFDDIFDNTQSNFKETADHQNYHISLSQVLTTKMLLSLNYDAVTDEGYLQNPYRNVLVLNDPADPDAGFNFNTPENYPNTRTSNALSANLLYYLPYRASVRTNYRYYTDDWDIDAHTVEVGYTHPLRDKWMLELRYRYYTQSDADFYSDVFQYPNQQNFMARDKELSEFSDHTLGFAVSYSLLNDNWGYIDRATLNFKYDHIWFKYDNFTDVTKSDLPEYEFDAGVMQLFFSAWY
jgi:hypothetical protein